MLALLLLGAAAVPGTAGAAFGLKNLDVTFAPVAGQPAMQAGSHPLSMTTEFELNTTTVPAGELPDQDAKDVIAALPPGLVGDPNATSVCSGADFAMVEKVTLRSGCPDSSAVGIAGVQATFGALPPGEPPAVYAPVYNLEPEPGSVARLGFIVLGVPVTVRVRLSQSPPYNVLAEATNISQAVQVFGAKLILWGNPSSPEHDPWRGSCLDAANSFNEPVSLGSCPVSIAERPFLTMPRSCLGPLATVFTADSWQASDLFTEPLAAQTHDESLPPQAVGTGGCSTLGFAPQVGAQLSSSQAESPSGLDFSLDVEDEGLTSPTGTAQSDIRKVVTTLPAGVTVNPSVAAGLGACTPADYARESAASAPGDGCPNSAKIGTAYVETPLLDEPLEGSLFVAQQDDPATATPEAENPFDSLLAVYIVIKNPRLGVMVKLAGRVEPNAANGQLVATFENLPQLPFSHFEVHFREGERAPLITPVACGTYTTRVLMIPWSDPARTLSADASLEITGGPDGGACGPAGFDPGLSAGTNDPIAGRYSSFLLRLHRDDGMQRLAGLDLTLPPGLTGKLAGIPYCPDDVLAAAASLRRPGEGAIELASPSCPAASRVGTVTVGAGAGSMPVYVTTGRAYLAGPYKGAPLSLAIVAPAVTGPFDLGNVVVRTALYVDPRTAQIRAVSDPLPTILQGIPLDLRDVRVTMDRSGFILNPTSCEPMSFTGSASSEQGATAPLAERFQVGSCGELRFAPKLHTRLIGSTKRSGHPQFRAVLQMPETGSANIAGASVTLPHSEFLDQGHIGTICTRPQYAAEACPGASVYGWAKAWTPLLDRPLVGKVYLRANGGERELPDLVADLNGQISVDLVGYIDSVKARIRNRFQIVPDAPVTKFMLVMKGGGKGLLENSTNLCKGSHRAVTRFVGHNGRVYKARPDMRASCGDKQKQHRARRHRRG